MKPTKVQKIVRRWRDINERANCIGNHKVEQAAFHLSITEELDWYDIAYRSDKNKIFVQVEKNTKDLLSLYCIFAIYAEEMKNVMKKELTKRSQRRLKKLYKELKAYDRILLGR